MGEEKNPLGKTALQKLTHLAQELWKCPLEYHFRLYNYGPYSRQLALSQDYLESIHGLDVEYDPDQGYSILPGRTAGDLERRGKAFLSKWAKPLDRLVKEFGSYQAWQLEIIATIVFVDRDHAKRSRSFVSLETLAEEVAEIKPRHDREYIARLVGILNEAGHLRSTSHTQPKRPRKG